MNISVFNLFWSPSSQNLLLPMSLLTLDYVNQTAFCLILYFWDWLVTNGLRCKQESMWWFQNLKLPNGRCLIIHTHSHHWQEGEGSFFRRGRKRNLILSAIEIAHKRFRIASCENSPTDLLSQYISKSTTRQHNISIENEGDTNR